MKVQYTERKYIMPETADLIEKINTILDEEYAKGYRLTIRSIYYQLRRRGWIVVPRNDNNKTYKRIGNTVSRGRMAGLIDWDHVIDSSRALRSFAGGDEADKMASHLNNVVNSYREDLWADQDTHVELWIEKNTLNETCMPPCIDLGVGMFSCHGYNSLSEMRRAALRLLKISEEKPVLILYVGDHDPSGLHIPENIQEMIEKFTFGLATNVEIRRIMLTKEQIKEFGCPPEIANSNDPRFLEYKKKNGAKSWETESLNSEDIDRIIRENINAVIDQEKWDAAELRQTHNAAELKTKWAGAMHYMKNVDEIKNSFADLVLQTARSADPVGRQLSAESNQKILDLLFPDRTREDEAE